MHNVHDQNFKDIFRDVILYIAPAILEIELEEATPIPEDFSIGSQRFPDFFHEVTDKSGKKYFVHLEFQVTNHPDMHIRMMQYYAYGLYNKGDNVIQKVLYFGDKKCTMKSRFKSPNMEFSYEILNFREIDYQVFFKSSNPQQIILSILGDYGEQKAEAVLEDTMRKIKSLNIGTNTKKNAFSKLYFLSRLRKTGSGKPLQKTFDKIRETMAIDFDIENDTLYKQGIEKGKAEGIEEGIEKGREMLILDFLKSLSPEQVAEYLGEKPETIEQIREKYKK